jgi:hypothetical protein
MAYYILIGLLVVSFVTILSMKDIKDANEADREYGKALEEKLTVDSNA